MTSAPIAESAVAAVDWGLRGGRGLRARRADRPRRKFRIIVGAAGRERVVGGVRVLAPGKIVLVGIAITRGRELLVLIRVLVLIREAVLVGG
jgi:hypothetical protein